MQIFLRQQAWKLGTNMLHGYSRDVKSCFYSTINLFQYTVFGWVSNGVVCTCIYFLHTLLVLNKPILITNQIAWNIKATYRNETLNFHWVKVTFVLFLHSIRCFMKTLAFYQSIHINTCVGGSEYTIYFMCHLVSVLEFHFFHHRSYIFIYVYTCVLRYFLF